MKKLIVVIMALITIFSASVSAFASQTFVDWQIVDTILNLEYSSTNCKVVFFNSDTPNVNWTNSLGQQKFQKTTYNVMNSMYETLTVYGASLSANAIFPQVYEWFEYDGYCFIRITVESNITGSVTDKFWVGNGSGKVLYCDAPSSETSYDVVDIAGVSNYYLTNRPAGTTGSGYLGDLLISKDNILTIQSQLNGLGSTAWYYTTLKIIDGQYRYYLMCSYPNMDMPLYFVCNSSGQLYYAFRDEVTDDGDTDSGSSFDATEVITAINSVYSAINSMSSSLGSRLATLINSTNGIASSVETLGINMVTGFTGVQEQLSTLTGYFSELSGLFPVQEIITLLGSDTRVVWDSADRITNVTTAGFNGDLIVKERSGPLIDESGYEKVTLSPDTTEYRLYNDADGYRRIVAQNEYPASGPAVPEDTFFYFPFDDSISSSIGDITLTSAGTPIYRTGVQGNAYYFDDTNGLTTTLSDSIPIKNSSFTYSLWLNFNTFPTDSFFKAEFRIGNNTMMIIGVDSDRYLQFTLRQGSSNANFTGSRLSLNTWYNIVVSCNNGTVYYFCDGVLLGSKALPSTVQVFEGRIMFASTPSGAVGLLDEVLFVNGAGLWTSSFDPYQEAVFTAVAADYFLPCTSQGMTLVFDDTLSKTLTPTDVNGNAITMGRLEDDFSEIYMDISTMMWYCHDPQTQTEILLSSANQQIMNDTIYVRQNYTMLPADQITADALQNLLPVDSPVYLDMPEGAKLTITYDHYTGWFRMMYMLMDKQTKLLSDLDIVNETIINVENTVIDITNSNPAYNVFYITKTDGTTESVGDAAKDAAVFVGDVLSMFYRLVFNDALDNVDILEDFEGVYSNTEVSVW